MELVGLRIHTDGDGLARVAQCVLKFNSSSYGRQAGEFRTWCNSLMVEIRSGVVEGISDGLFSDCQTLGDVATRGRSSRTLCRIQHRYYIVSSKTDNLSV